MSDLDINKTFFNLRANSGNHKKRSVEAFVSQRPKKTESRFELTWSEDNWTVKIASNDREDLLRELRQFRREFQSYAKLNGC